MGKKKLIALESKYYTENEVNAFIDQLEIIDAKKADVDTTFSKTEVNKLISDALSVNTPVVKLDTLPTTGEENTFYLIPESNKTTNNNYNIYLWINNVWEQIDAVNFDISSYAKQEDVDQSIQLITDDIFKGDQTLSTNIEDLHTDMLTQIQDAVTSLSETDTINSDDIHTATNRIQTLENWQTVSMAGGTALLTQSMAEDLYYQKSSVDSILAGLKTEVNARYDAAMAANATKANITDVYNKTEIDTQLNTINTALDKILGV